MQPPHLLLASISATPLLMLALWSGTPGQADPEQAADAAPTLLAALPNPDNRIWVRVVDPITVSGLASALDTSPSQLSELNDVSLSHRFQSGDWVALEASGADRVAEVGALDEAQLRRTAPEPAAPRQDERLTAAATVLNPGAAAGALLGRVQTPEARALGRARTTLAIRPTTSGGISWPEIPDFQTKPSQPVLQASWIWPTKGVFTSGYGWRWGRMHKGIDIANNVGTPIVAAQQGVVDYAGWASGYGYLVELRHPDGTLTRYAHNSKMLVRKGQIVAQGQRISLMGSTGRSTGPHLHFEVIPPGRGAINPLKLLPSRA
ncbi:M23 family metallopeptidase [Synechococcus sp. RSCCF101]|uniref:M23 family metallopeptidase n=1 Tax=Synechococcus sp. RSCCF101 TaxID=2511069 RepID=UPI0012488505|nr:M23 family metallopeptidase [Synechococcus sp. RSCCF101]QEY31751.1 M23 family metallopeptidase [Synechococcus sp. RSCCF101]